MAMSLETKKHFKAMYTCVCYKNIYKLDDVTCCRDGDEDDGDVDKEDDEDDERPERLDEQEGHGSDGLARLPKQLDGEGYTFPHDQDDEEQDDLM